MIRLIEVTRQELIRKNRNETPERYARRMNYVNTIKPLGVTKDLFINTGTLTVPINVGDYIVTIHISGIMKLIRQELDRSGKTLPDRPLVYRALRKAVDESNIYVDCTCPDFRYRFSYWSTRNDYKYGKPETRPADITNPDNKGSICKHITAALVRPSQWLKYVAGWISTVVRAYLEQKLNINAEDIEDLNPTEVKDEIEDIQDVSNDILDDEESENDLVEISDDEIVDEEDSEE